MAREQFIFEEFWSAIMPLPRMVQSAGGEPAGRSGAGQLLERGGLTSSVASNPAHTGIMRELDRLQSEQVHLARRIEKEKRRKEALELDLRQAKDKLRQYQDATKGGSIVKDEDTVSRKLIAKLEHSLQQARIKLSATHKDNATHKHRIDETRQDKIMHLNILRNLEREYHESKVKIAAQQKEIIEVNEEKHRLDVHINNMKESMFRDMNLFSNELVNAKRNISQTQTNILDSIRERLQNTFNNLDLLEDDAGASSKHAPPTPAARVGNEAEERRVALQELLQEVQVESLEKLIVTLQQSEEVIFAKYNDIQSATSDKEKLELENKHLEEEVARQTAELEELESSNEKKQRDLGLAIANIQASTAKYEADFEKNEAALSLMQNNMVKLFKNIAIDEALDQQIIENGVNDRNIPEYLGLVEQRIDELIQMRKAAEHQLLEREDFGKSAFRKKEGSLVRPTLPDSRFDGPDDDLAFGDEGVGAGAGAGAAAVGEGRVQPVSISMLKEFMHKKVQRGLKKGALAEALVKAGQKGGGGARGALPSREKGPGGDENSNGVGGANGLDTSGGDGDTGDNSADASSGHLPSKAHNRKHSQFQHHHHSSEAKRRGTRYKISTGAGGTDGSEGGAAAGTGTSPIRRSSNFGQPSRTSTEGANSNSNSNTGSGSGSAGGPRRGPSASGSVRGSASSSQGGTGLGAAMAAAAVAAGTSGTRLGSGERFSPVAPVGGKEARSGSAGSNPLRASRIESR